MECRLNVRWIAAAPLKPNFDRSLAGPWDGRAPVTGFFRFCLIRILTSDIRILLTCVHYSVKWMNISYEI